MKMYKYIEMYVEKYLCENIQSIQNVYKDCLKNRNYKNIYNV